MPELFRFSQPKKEGFPYQIELLSKYPDILGVPTDFHLTPISIGDEVSSLSAILIDEEFYHFALAHSVSLASSFLRGNNRQAHYKTFLYHDPVSIMTSYMQCHLSIDNIARLVPSYHSLGTMRDTFVVPFVAVAGTGTKCVV